MNHVDYSYLTKRFNTDLVDKLRGHGEDDEVLSLWVPNENIIRSLSNFLAALKETNQKEYFLKIEETLITQFEIDQLSKSQIGSFKITCEYVKNYFYLDIVNLNKSIKSTNKLDDWKAKEIVRKVDYKYGVSYIKKIDQKILETILKYSHHSKYFIENTNLFESDISIISEEISIYMKLDDKFNISKFKYKTETPIFAGLCEILGKFSEDIPFKEFYEHGILKVIHKLVNETENFNIEGILLTNNLGPEFVILNKLVINLKSKFEKFSNVILDNTGNINFYDAPPGKDWLNKTENERNNNIIEMISLFERRKKLPNASISYLKLDNDLSNWPVRIYISIDDEKIQVPNKPYYIRQLEEYLRKNLDNKLQIFYEELKDKNKIRRL